MLEELETLARRLEQQIVAYEKLHTEEMKRFQEQFEAFQRIQADELQMLRKQLDQLTEDIAAFKQIIPQSKSEENALDSEPTLSRRDLLTGKMPPIRPQRSQG